MGKCKSNFSGTQKPLFLTLLCLLKKYSQERDYLARKLFPLLNFVFETSFSNTFMSLKEVFSRKGLSREKTLPFTLILMEAYWQWKMNRNPLAAFSLTASLWHLYPPLHRPTDFHFLQVTTDSKLHASELAINLLPLMLWTEPNTQGTRVEVHLPLI